MRPPGNSPKLGARAGTFGRPGRQGGRGSLHCSPAWPRVLRALPSSAGQIGWEPLRGTPMFPRRGSPRLTIRRLLLRALTPPDWDTLLANYSDLKKARRFMENPAASADLVDEILRESITNFDRGTGATRAVVWSVSGNLLGTCGYEHAEVGPEGEIGFDLAKAHRGRV